MRSVAGVLREIRNVKQERGPGRRRWFEAEAFELVVWFDGQGEKVSGFQVGYDFGQGERALTWREGEGFAHSIVDTGDADPLRNETPVLRPEPNVPWAEIVRAFEACSGGLERELRELVQGKLRARR